jgi:RES domain-containing protein
LKIYRIAKKKFIRDLSGEGARLFGGRWNKKGQYMVYFSETLSLSVLEILVHLDYKYLNKDFYFIEVELPSKFIKPIVKIKNLSDDWRNNPPLGYTKEIGTQWLLNNKSLAMRVPSAVLPSESNILLNPNNKLISEIKILKIVSLNIDERILK